MKSKGYSDGSGEAHIDGMVMGKFFEKVDNIETTVNKINERLEKNYVTNDRLAPIEKLVYGMVGLILIGFVGAIVKFFIIK